MTRENMKDFLSDLIEVYPGYKTRIFNQDTFVDNWMAAYGDRSEEDIRAAGQICIDKGNRFFPTTEEFRMSLVLVDSRKTVAAQEEYERTHPTSEEDQRKLDAAIYELFEKEDA